MLSSLYGFLMTNEEKGKKALQLAIAQDLVAPEADKLLFMQVKIFRLRYARGFYTDKLTLLAVQLDDKN